MYIYICIYVYIYYNICYASTLTRGIDLSDLSDLREWEHQLKRLQLRNKQKRLLRGYAPRS